MEVDHDTDISDSDNFREIKVYSDALDQEFGCVLIQNKK